MCCCANQFSLNYPFSLTLPCVMSSNVCDVASVRQVQKLSNAMHCTYCWYVSRLFACGEVCLLFVEVAKSIQNPQTQSSTVRKHRNEFTGARYMIHFPIQLIQAQKYQKAIWQQQWSFYYMHCWPIGPVRRPIKSYLFPNNHLNQY